MYQKLDSGFATFYQLSSFYQMNFDPISNRNVVESEPH